MIKNKVFYLSGLNGLRAIAALTVLVNHISLPMLSDFKLKTFNLSGGIDGVTLFFVISGFLITYLLLLEKDETNEIKIMNFYMRRILRIWPIYYIFIVVCLFSALYYSKINDIYSIKLLFYLFFTSNIPFITQTGITVLAHYWSISVEEQFYLFWPWFIRLKQNKLIPVTVGLICMFFILKSGFWYFLGHDSIIYKSFAVTRFHCMLIGALGAMYYKNDNRIFINLLINKFVQIVAWLCFILLFINYFKLPAPLIAEVTSLLSLVLIVGQIEPTKIKIINLENNLFDFIGKISYGIYIIHPLVILFYSVLYKNIELSIIFQTIIIYLSVISTTIFLAYISYECFEKRFLKLKIKFTSVQSSNSKLIYYNNFQNTNN